LRCTVIAVTAPIDPSPAEPTNARFASLEYVPPSGVRWGLADAATGIALFLTVLGLFAVAATAVPVLQSDFGALVLNLGGYGSLIGAAVVASRRSGLRRLSLDFGLSVRWSDLWLGLIIAVVAKALVYVYIVLADAVTGAEPTGGNLSLSDSSVWVVINGLLFTALLAPFAEELFMRGLLLRSVRNSVLRGWLQRRPQPAERSTQIVAVIVAIAASSLVFMALHMFQSTDPGLLIVLGLSTLTLGVLNGVAAVRTGRLGAPIIAHILFNGSSVLGALVLGL
jgi:membrane protease YdiL (CAAX protease family)